MYIKVDRLLWYDISIRYKHVGYYGGYVLIWYNDSSYVVYCSNIEICYHNVVGVWVLVVYVCTIRLLSIAGIINDYMGIYNLE